METKKSINAIFFAYYSRKDIQNAIFNFCRGRESIPRYEETFGKRPDTLEYPSDVQQLVNKGAISIHCSEELWTNPLEISTSLKPEQIENLRQGWDLLIDIDSKYLDYSKISAKLIINALKFHNIKNFGIKFSGSKGFHIIVPWKAFPDKIYEQETKNMFPEWPRIIVQYIKSLINKKLIENISDISIKNRKSYVKDNDEAEKVVPDLVLVAPRHLFRAPYSIDFDEPICIKKDNKVKIMKIGEFVDRFFNKEKDFQITNLSKLNYKTISLNFHDNKTRYCKIKKAIRHKINEDLFLIKLESGRKIRATSGHSLFILRDGKIRTIKGDQIKKEDYIICLRKINLGEKQINNLYLAEELIKVLDKEEKRNVFLYQFDTSIFDKIYKVDFPKRKKQNIYNWKVYNILPLDAYELLLKKGIVHKEDFQNSRIKFCLHGGGTLGLQNNFEINKELMRLLGYYISEGHSDINRTRVSFSFGSHEKDLINDCINILKRLQLKPRIEKPHKTATIVTLNSSTLKLVLTRLFNCGRNAIEKRVPSIIWNLDNRLKTEFLNAYIKGDGHLEKRWSKVVISTISKKLSEDLCFLLTSLGLGYSLSERKITKWSKGKRLSYVIIVQGKGDVQKLGFDSFSKVKKNSLINRFPIKEIGLEQSILESEEKNQYLKNRIIRRGYDFIKKFNPNKKVLKLISGDTAFLKVVSISKIKSTHNYVYDLSVEDDENFVGGNCILLHNSLHEKGLVSVVIDEDELDSFQPKLAHPLKVKVKNFYPEPEKDEARELLMSALDWYKEKSTSEKNPKKHTNKKFQEIKIHKKNIVLAPSIEKILKGLNDGRKRALFILLNYFRSLGLDFEDIEEKIEKWNKKNKPPLKQGYISSQLTWSKRNKKVLPPNYDKYYKDIGIFPTEEELQFKNPVNFTVKKSKWQKK